MTEFKNHGSLILETDFWDKHSEIGVDFNAGNLRVLLPPKYTSYLNEFRQAEWISIVAYDTSTSVSARWSHGRKDFTLTALPIFSGPDDDCREGLLASFWEQRNGRPRRAVEKIAYYFDERMEETTC